MLSPIALALGGFFAVLFVLAFWASGRIETEEDFIVAGRSMPGWVSFSTLLATWFSAGSLLISADAVYVDAIFTRTDPAFHATVRSLIRQPRPDPGAILFWR